MRFGDVRDGFLRALEAKKNLSGFENAEEAAVAHHGKSSCKRTTVVDWRDRTGVASIA